jgi:hypothetical protein
MPERVPKTPFAHLHLSPQVQVSEDAHYSASK